MSSLFQSVLFPTDFSDASVGALNAAIELAKTFKAELHCIHVVDDAYQYWSALGPESIPIGPLPEDLIKLGQARLEKFCRERLSDIPVVHDVVMGRPFAEIIQYARDHNICLIVMGTHGRGAIAHMLLGSTTEKVVRKAPCAVLTVRSKDHTFAMP